VEQGGNTYKRALTMEKEAQGISDKMFQSDSQRVIILQLWVTHATDTARSNQRKALEFSERLQLLEF
jgi:hypothetical protein